MVNKNEKGKGKVNLFFLMTHKNNIYFQMTKVYKLSILLNKT